MFYNLPARKYCQRVYVMSTSWYVTFGILLRKYLIWQVNYIIGISLIERSSIDIRKIKPNTISRILSFALNEISFWCMYMLSLFSIFEFKVYFRYAKYHVISFAWGRRTNMYMLVCTHICSNACYEEITLFPSILFYQV